MRGAARALPLVALAAGCAPQRECGAQLWYVDNGAADEVVAIGEWNGWDPAADPLEQLEPGRQKHPRNHRLSRFVLQGNHRRLAVNGYGKTLFCYETRGESRQVATVGHTPTVRIAQKQTQLRVARDNGGR